MTIRLLKLKNVWVNLCVNEWKTSNVVAVDLPHQKNKPQID